MFQRITSPHEDKHKAPASTQPHPLSLQETGDVGIPLTPFPRSVGTIHQIALTFSSH